MAKKQVTVGDLKKGDEFTDISPDSGTLGQDYVVTWVGSSKTTAYMRTDKYGDDPIEFPHDELVEVHS